MGNSDSQPAVPNTAGTGFSLPRRPKPCSLRFRPTKRKVLSPQSWWRGREVGQGSGLRAPFVHSQYSCFGELTTDRCDRYCTSSGTAASWDLGGDATGVLYAERDAVLDRPVGPVHLLQLARASDHAEANAPPLWTSKGSSLSSEGSWYDSPWGATGELSDADRSCSSGHIEDTRDSASSSGPMEESSAGGGAGRTTIDASLSAPSGGPLALRADLRGFHSLTPTTFADLYGNPSVTSCSSVSGGGAKESCPEPGGFSSHTLPCRKAVPDTDSSSRKSLLKGRMRRFGDWTGSLSRKRRRLQSNDPESLDSGVDVQMDSSPSLPWYLGPYQATPSPGSTYASTLPTRRRRNEDDDHGTFRQNVYETFMRELETVHGADELEPSKETEETSSDSGGSLEQLDLLLEKEHGLVRRAGWLSFKPLITLHKDRRLELVPRRRWRRYWVTLKGCTLLFYESFGKSLEGQDTAPRYALFAEGSIVQAVPEHPKKENVFCLSNAYGDVYLFQAESQTELENWVAAVHSACASLLARQHGKADALRLLRSQTHGLLQKVDMDSKMKKMAELQLSVVNDQKNRKAIESQIEQWERNLERFHMDLFRVRCYLASLQGGEPPNPKMLLAAASRPSKATLGRLGIFSVSSFHALVCSRDEATLRRRSRSQSHGTRRGLLSSLKGLDTLTRRGRDKKQPISQVLQKNPDGQLGCLLACSFEDQKLDGLANHYSIAPPEGNLWDSSLKTSVYFLDNQVINVTVKHDHTVADMLSLACKVRQLDPGHHCLRVSMGMGPETEFITPAPGDLAQGMQSGKLLVFPLNVHTMRLTRPDSSVDYGFAVTGHVDGSRTSHIFVSDINPDGLAFAEGLRPGDEILVLNGSDVSTLDLGLMQTHFGQLKLSLILRREDVALEDQTPIWPDARPTDFSLLVPPPCPLGVCADMQDEQLSAQLSAEAAAGPDVTCRSLGPCRDEKPDLADGRSQHLQGLETVSMLMPEAQESLGCLIELQRTPQAGLPQPPCPRNRPSTEKLRKVMQELVDTEKSYVKDLSCLFEIYLKPLQTQTFLSLAEMESLFGSLPEMLEFQRVFLQTLEDRISSSPDFSTLETPEQVKKLLLSLGGSFLYYADHFKLYSGFCANHTKVQKVLERAKTDWAFKEFLEAKNPTKQHSSTLESYLIKPVQRVLRYPLLLRELVSLTEAGSQEHLHLSEALKAMEKVASHINEMQKIYEDYGVVFDQLVAEQSSTEKEVTEISMGEFLMHSSVTWLNPLPSLGRMRKDPELTVFVFRRAVILVCRDGSRMKRRAQAAARSAASQSDPDPFRFRWLVPLSALQVRLGSTAGSEPNCIWELIHTKSELEGRPEMPFQLCSSSLEAKATIVRTIRSLLREGARRTGPPWRGSRERLGSTPTGAGASLTSWLRKGPQAPTDALDSSQLNPDEGTQSCGTRSSISDLRDLLREQSGSWHPQEQSPAPQQPLGDVPGRKDAERQGPQHDCLTSTIEAQLRRLWLVEEKALMLNAPCVQPEQVVLDTHTVMGSTPPAADNPCESQGAPLDGTASADLSGLLERDFSVHSLTSVVNEDCFYDKPERVAPCVRPSSAGASSCSPD